MRTTTVKYHNRKGEKKSKNHWVEVVITEQSRETVALA